MNLINQQDLFRVSDAAKYLGVTPGRIYQLIEQRSMGQRILGVWVFTKQELDAWANEPRDPRGRPRKVVRLREQALQAAQTAR